MADLQLSDLSIRVSQDGTYGLIDNLRADLLSMSRFIEHGDGVSIGIAQAIEREVLEVLDLISPEIRSTIAEFERYQAMPKIGDHDATTN
jgi:hypothetical protein